MPYIIDDNCAAFGMDGSGHQIKIWVDNNTRLIKLDSKYRESSKEVSACLFGKAFGLPVIIYTQYTFLYHDALVNGCICDTYLKRNKASLTLSEILKNVSIPMKMSARDFF